MKLCIATGLYQPDIGGPATYTAFLESHARELGVEFVVVPFGTVRKFPPVMRHFVYFFSLLRKGRSTDMLYALDTVSVGVPVLCASFFLRKPYLLRVPGDYAWEQGQQRFGITETLDEYRVSVNRSFPVRVLAWFQGLVARSAHHVVVPSEYMKRVVTEWGVPKERITRIYSVLKPISSHTKESDDGNDFVVATAGRLVPWKGIRALIDVVSELRQKGQSVVLRIYGDGVCRAELEAQVRELGVNDYIHFFGSLSREKLGEELSRAHVFVLNTAYEGLSHQLLEVMDLGIPVITTAVGGNAELIAHEESGLIIPYNDKEAIQKAILSVRDDDARARSRSDRARASLDRFKETTIIQETKAFFQSHGNSIA